MLPVEFKGRLGPSGRMTIPKEVRESVEIRENDVLQIAVRGIVAGRKHWIELKNQPVTCVRVQKRYVIRIPNSVRKCAGLRGREEVVVRIEKVMKWKGESKRKRLRIVHIRREYIEKFNIHKGDIIQVTIIRDDEELPEDKQMTVTAKMQKTTVYIPKYVADFYKGKLGVKVDRVFT